MDEMKKFYINTEAIMSLVRGYKLNINNEIEIIPDDDGRYLERGKIQRLKELVYAKANADMLYELDRIFEENGFLPPKGEQLNKQEE